MVPVAMPLHISENQAELELEEFSNPQQSIRSDVEAITATSGPHSEIRSQLPTSEQLQSLWNPHKNRFRVLASCMTAFGNGMNDAAAGALIASLEKYVSHGVWIISDLSKAL